MAIDGRMGEVGVPEFVHDQAEQDLTRASRADSVSNADLGPTANQAKVPGPLAMPAISCGRILPF